MNLLAGVDQMVDIPKGPPASAHCEANKIAVAINAWMKRFMASYLKNLFSECFTMDRSLVDDGPGENTEGGKSTFRVDSPPLAP
ncbi:MAG: hypothetical protein ACPGUC_09860 [Gammaproteobacteria bacterium]